MRIQIIFSLLSTFLINSCGDSEKPSKLFEIQLEGKRKQIKNGDILGVAIENKKEKAIKSITYSLNGEEMVLNDGKITFNATTLGNKTLKAHIVYDEDSAEIKKISAFWQKMLLRSILTKL